VKRLLPFALLAGCLLVRGPAAAQLVLGQYEDEAPLGTWNSLGSPPAGAVGLGGAQFARPWDASVSLANPALLTGLPRFSASLSGSYGGASLYRYSLVNTGPVMSTGNLSARVFGVDGVAVAFRAGAWAFAAAAAAPESYARPPVDIAAGGYELTFDQTGYLRVFHAAIARRFGARLSLGVALNAVAGRLDRRTVDRTSDTSGAIVITDDKSERYRGFFVNAGLTWQATPRLTAGLAVRSPFAKKGSAASLLRYEAPAGGTDIRIEASDVNSYRQPWVVGAGLSYRFSPSWSLAADAAFFGWSGYAATFFGEPLARPFRNVVKAGGGVEYLAPARLYGRTARIPFRLGVLADPQPATSLRSTYLALTFGTGLELRALAFGISGAYGRETGSGRSLKTAKIVATVRYVFED
jgi:long-subunit fatty acid transport protein